MFELKKSFLIFLLLSSMTFINSQQEDAQAEQMKAWIEYSEPGLMHTLMAKFVGNWKTINKHWVYPAGEPMVTEGDATIEMILDGRYQISNHTSKHYLNTDPEGKMKGMSLMGYDNATREFTSIWIDNMGTGFSISKGKYDEVTNSINFEGSVFDPITKEDMKFRQVVRIIDANHHMFEMYMNYNGLEFKSMEIEYNRQ